MFKDVPLANQSLAYNELEPEIIFDIIAAISSVFLSGGESACKRKSP